MSAGAGHHAVKLSCHFVAGSKRIVDFPETRDIRSNIALCRREFVMEKPEGTPEGKGLKLTKNL